MKKILLIIAFILLIPFMVNASNNSNLLYDTIKNEVSGGYAKEYTGEHIDKFDGTGREKIYYWYGPDNDHVNYIETKRNVLFAGFCWQTVRTTDSGGVKLLYNGIAENGKCLDNRPDITVDYGVYSTTVRSYKEDYYGTSYTYDESTGKYKLSGDLVKLKLNDDNGKSVEGMYTFWMEDADFSATYKPTKIVTYFADGYTMDGGENPYNYSYSSIGASVMHTTYSRDGIAGAGYMFNNPYPVLGYYFNVDNMGSYTQDGTTLTDSDVTIIQNTGEQKYTYDSSTNTWKSTRATPNGNSIFKFKVNVTGTVLLKYDFNNYSNGRTTIYKNDEKILILAFDGSGTVVIDNVTSNDVITIDNSLTYRSYYFDFSIVHGTGEATDTRYYYGNDVVYENGEYRLIDTVRSEGPVSFDEHHYFCPSGVNHCETVTYFFSGSDVEYLSGYRLSNGDKIEDVYNRQLDDDDINHFDSVAKYLIDYWYKNNMVDYQNNLEDIVYCNDRRIYGENPFYKDNKFAYSLYFNPYSRDVDSPEFAYNNSLACPRVLDQFSTKNSKAKLTYPVALLNLPEVFLLNVRQDLRGRRSKALVQAPGTNDMMLIMSHYGLRSRWSVYGLGFMSDTGVSNGGLIRPVVSLKKGTKYISGTGSQEDPLIIPNVYNITVDNSLLSGSVDSDISFEDVPESTNVVFKVNPRRGFDIDRVVVIDSDNNEIELILDDGSYSFTMPSKNVTIKTYYKINVPNTIKNISFGLLSFIMILISIGIIRVCINMKEKE